MAVCSGVAALNHDHDGGAQTQRRQCRTGSSELDHLVKAMSPQLSIDVADDHLRLQVQVAFRNLKASMADAGLLFMVKDNCDEDFLLKSTVICLCRRTLPWIGLMTVASSANVRSLIPRGAVICVECEERWGLDIHPWGGASADSLGC